MQLNMGSARRRRLTKKLIKTREKLVPNTILPKAGTYQGTDAYAPDHPIHMIPIIRQGPASIDPKSLIKQHGCKGLDSLELQVIWVKPVTYRFSLWRQSPTTKPESKYEQVEDECLRSAAKVWRQIYSRRRVSMPFWRQGTIMPLHQDVSDGSDGGADT